VLGGSAAAAAGAGTSSAAAAGSGAAAAAAAAALGDAVSAELSQAMGPLIQALAQRHPVCSMANVRQWLQQQGDAQPLAKQAAQLSDAVLDALVQATAHVLHIRRMYVAKTGTNATTEGLRKVRASFCRLDGLWWLLVLLCSDEIENGSLLQAYNVWYIADGSQQSCRRCCSQLFATVLGWCANLSSCARQ
jgi:hypothetical protein